MPSASDFETFESLGKNAYGTVYRGVQFSLKRDVAIFELNPALRKEAEQSPQFWDEINRLAQINDDALVPVIAVVRDRGWIILELVAANCSCLLGQPQSPEVARSILRQALSGLSRLHEGGRRHDDLRPHTLLIHRNGRVKLSLALGSAVVGGTPYHLRNMKYVAPELVSPALGEHGPRSDLYSLGFTVIELLVGSKFNDLFPGIGDEHADDRTAWMRWHSSPTSVLPSVRQLAPHAPQELVDVLDRLVRKPVAERYASAAAALADLANVQLVSVPVPAGAGGVAAGSATLRSDIDRLNDPESRFNAPTPVTPAGIGAAAAVGAAARSAPASPRSDRGGAMPVKKADAAAQKKRKDRMTIVLGCLFVAVVMGVMVWLDAPKKEGEGAGPAANATPTTPPPPPPLALANLTTTTAREGEKFETKLSLVDAPADAPATTFKLVGDGPNGLELKPDGSISWTPNESQGGAPAKFKVKADRVGPPAQEVEREYALEVAEVNAPPKLIVQAGPKEVVAGQTLKFVLQGEDVDLPKQKLSFRLVDASSSAKLDSAGGEFVFSPAETEAPKVYDFNIEVEDDGSPKQTAREKLSITVKPIPNRPPVIADVTPPPAKVGQLWTLQLKATDPDKPPQKITFGWASGATPLPGASIDAVSGTITWEPPESPADQSVTFAVAAGDDGMPPQTARREFTVKISGPNKPPVFEKVADRTLEPAASLDMTVKATDPDGAAGGVRYSIDAKQSTLPEVTVDAATGRVSWSHSPGKEGRYYVAVKAVDKEQPPAEATVRFRVTVRDRNVPPEFRPITDPMVSLPLSSDSRPVVQLRIDVYDPNDPGGLPRFVLVDAGSLRGVELDARTGLLTWRPPNRSDVTPGRYPITVEVFDTGAPPLSAKKTFTIEVR